MTVADILNRAADLIEPEGAWTQNWFAKDAEGRDTAPLSAGAVCWCAFGALERAIGGRSYDRLNEAVDAMCRATGIRMISDWNDNPDRTQAEVVAKLREAAELARAGASS